MFLKFNCWTIWSDNLWCDVPEDGTLFTMVTVVMSHRSYCNSSVFLCSACLFRPFSSTGLSQKEGHWLEFSGSLFPSFKGLIKDVNLPLMFKHRVFQKHIFNSHCLTFLIYKIRSYSSLCYINKFKHTNKHTKLFPSYSLFSFSRTSPVLWFWSNEYKLLYFIYKTSGLYLNG